MNLKIQRVKLIDALEKEKVRRIHEYAKEKTDFPSKFSAYRASVAEELEKCLALVNKARTIKEIEPVTNRYERKRLQFDGCPSEPKKPKTCQVNEYIAVLKLATDEFIQIGSESPWLRELAIKCSTE